MTAIPFRVDAEASPGLYRQQVLAPRWRVHRPPDTDVLIAIVWVVIGQLVTWMRLEDQPVYAGPRLTNAALSLLFMAAFAWRRRAPLGVMVWAVTVYFVTQAVVLHDMTFLAGGVPLIALTASAGYHGTRRQAQAAAALGLVALVIVTLTTSYLRSVDALAWNTAFLMVPWLMARGLRKREDRAATLSAALVTERATTEAALRRAAAEERARIARDLHDIVAHSVSVMVIQVGAARMQLRTGADAAEAPLLEAEDVGRQALEDLRRLLDVLRADEPTRERPDTGPEPPQRGLSELDGILARTRAAGLRVNVEVVGEPVTLPATLDLTAYRIVQEALTNTLRHGEATEATVRLAYMPTALEIDIVDDGTGTAGRDGPGHGLTGISERATLFGGTATAGSVRDGGWQVHAELPLPGLSTRSPRRASLPAS